MVEQRVPERLCLTIRISGHIQVHRWALNTPLGLHVLSSCWFSLFLIRQRPPAEGGSADELWRINWLKKTESVKWSKSVCRLQVKCSLMCSYIQNPLFILCVFLSFIYSLFLPWLSLLKFLSCGELPAPLTVCSRWQRKHYKLYPNQCI